jgi:predicted nucleic acid-binding protein
MIVDSSALVALFNRRDPHHDTVSAALASDDDDLVLSPFVLAEVGDLVSRRLGVAAELDVLRALSSEAWTLAPFASADVVRATEVVERCRDLDVGLADASLVVLADRYRTRRIATLDRRHFEVLRPLSGGRFTLVPG